MSDADRPSCRHGDSFSPECSMCRGYRVEAEAAARIATLEARIAELERERDSEFNRAAAAYNGLCKWQGEYRKEKSRADAARADLDEAVRVLQRWHDSYRDDHAPAPIFDTTAYLARHPTPDKETT